MDKRIDIDNRKSCFDLPEKAEEFIQYFRNRIDSIPIEYRSSAIIEIDTESYYDSSSSYFYIYYYRPETQEELAENEVRAVLLAETQKSAKLREFERLRKELGL